MLSSHFALGCRPLTTARVIRTPFIVRAQSETKTSENVKVERAGLAELGPIGITVGQTDAEKPKSAKQGGAQMMQNVADKAGVSLGPIGLTVGSDLRADSSTDEDAPPPTSIASMTTAEWRAKFENPDGTVSLWVEDEFNAASRLIGGRAAHYGLPAGIGSGEGPSTAPRHRVKINNHFASQEIGVDVPEDRYILYEAEDQGLVLPYACRLGCCTACAVKVKSGELYQPHALGVSKELRERGYALMCVAFPLTDCELETVPEDEVYDLQFGQFFAAQALDPYAPNVERDEWGLEIAAAED